MNLSDIPLIGQLFGGSADNVDPAAATAKLNAAYGQAKLDLANAQTDAVRTNAQAKLDQIKNAQDALATRQASVGVQQQNADTNAQKAGNTADYHQRSLDIRQSADQALSDYRNAMMAAKGNANQINMAKVQYQHQMSMINAQLSQLKDEVTADTQLDTNADTGSVTQADARNNAALSATDNAAARVASPDMIKYGGFAGNPSGAAGAMAGIMQAGAAQSNAIGGAPVDPQQLALQHKMQIADLVMNKGVSFADAVKTVTAAGDPGATLGNGFVSNPPSGFSVNPSGPSAETAAGTYTGGP